MFSRVTDARDQASLACTCPALRDVVYDEATWRDTVTTVPSRYLDVRHAPHTWMQCAWWLAARGARSLDVACSDYAAVSYVLTSLEEFDHTDGSPRARVFEHLTFSDGGATQHEQVNHHYPPVLSDQVTVAMLRIAKEEKLHNLKTVTFQLQYMINSWSTLIENCSSVFPHFLQIRYSNLKFNSGILHETSQLFVDTVKAAQCDDISVIVDREDAFAVLEELFKLDDAPPTKLRLMVDSGLAFPQSFTQAMQRSRLTHLTVEVCRNNSITSSYDFDDVLEYLPEHLEVFQLCNAWYTCTINVSVDKLLAALSRLPKLWHVTLSDVHLSNPTPRRDHSQNNVEMINFFNIDFKPAGSSFFDALLDACPSLHTVELKGDKYPALLIEQEIMKLALGGVHVCFPVANQKRLTALQNRRLLATKKVTYT
jgi:hypothetical protein